MEDWRVLLHIVSDAPLGPNEVSPRGWKVAVNTLPAARKIAVALVVGVNAGQNGVASSPAFLALPSTSARLSTVARSVRDPGLAPSLPSLGDEAGRATAPTP